MLESSTTHFRRAVARFLADSVRRTKSFYSGPPLPFVLAALILFNVRSFPLVWHVRVLRHLVMWNVRKFLAPSQRRYMEETSPVAQDPFQSVITHKFWAGPDDCDFLGHLSNSSYAKNLDVVRMKVCVTNLRLFMGEGGWMPLAGADYAYISEIPLFTSYEIRAKISGWDEKWIYLYSEFITRPHSDKGTKRTTSVAPAAPNIRSRCRADGTVLHCAAISRYCFKLGRITVPPSVVLSISGFGVDRRNWNRACSMKSRGELRRFLEGGWRDEKGWDMYEFDQQRQIGMESCAKLTEGIQGVTETKW